MNDNNPPETNQNSPGALTEERRSQVRLERDRELRARKAWVDSLDERVANGNLHPDTRSTLISLAMVGSVRDKFAEEGKNEKDPMTGLYRQEHLRHGIKKMIDKGEPFALLFTDLDNFGEINKKYGQDAGDEIMVQSAMRIRECLRENEEENNRDPDLPFRNGGDETAIIFPGIKSNDVLLGKSEGIRKAINSARFAIPLSDTKLNLTVSIGGIIWNGQTQEVLLRDAGEALRASKATRNAVTIK